MEEEVPPSFWQFLAGRPSQQTAGDGVAEGPQANHELVHLHRLEILAEAFPWSFRLFATLHCMIGLLQIALIIWVATSLVQDWNLECDQPLHTWVLVDLVSNVYQTLHGIVFHNRFHENTSRCVLNGEKIIMVTIVVFSLAWEITGIHWVFAADTCDRTAPRLYTAVKLYIIFVIALTAFIGINAIGLYTILSRLVEFEFIELESAAPPDTLEKLRVVKFEENAKEFEDNTECCICMVDFARGGQIRMTPCNHMFHSKCLSNWFKVNRTCPLCRADVVRELQSLEDGQGNLARTVGRREADEDSDGTPEDESSSSPLSAGVARGEAEQRTSGQASQDVDSEGCSRPKPSDDLSI